VAAELRRWAANNEKGFVQVDVSGFQKPFGEWAKSVQSRLNYEYEASRSVLSHGTLLGAIREGVIRDILQGFLPLSVEVGTGQVIDSLGVSSKQIDIIIAEGEAPAFRFEGGVSAFLYEAVLATIEVKSMLYHDKLHEALDNSNSVKGLTYLLHVREKGNQVFAEAFEWVDSAGGLGEVERRILSPSIKDPIGCPEGIWQILPFVRYWLHWTNGDFSRPETFQRLTEILETPHFDFFVHLLQSVLNQNDPCAALWTDFGRAEEIKDEFFAQLYENLLYEELPPATFILAYGGYENLNNMVSEVRNWYDHNREDVEWCALPRVIMNHRMFMYRHYNEYHCNEFEYPILFFMNGLCSVLTQSLAFSRSISARTEILRYFDIARILGEEHPKHSPSYLVWSIPLDGSSSGEIKAMNED